MYQFICFAYYVLFQTSLIRGGDVQAAKDNAGWLGLLYFLPFCGWLLYVGEPLTGIKSALENVWNIWWDGRFDPRLGPAFLFVLPLSFLLYRFCITRRHEAIVARFYRVKLPRLLSFGFVYGPLGMAIGFLAAASDPWPLAATLGMAALWLLVELGFRAWLKRNTLPAPSASAT